MLKVLTTFAAFLCYYSCAAQIEVKKEYGALVLKCDNRPYKELLITIANHFNYKLVINSSMAAKERPIVYHGPLTNLKDNLQVLEMCCDLKYIIQDSTLTVKIKQP